MNNNNEIYIVTGSSSGLGKSIVSQLNNEGINSIGIDKDKAPTTNLNIDLGNLSEDDCKKIKDLVENKKIKSIVHCAAVQKNSDHDFENLSASFNEIFFVNTKSIYLLTMTLKELFTETSSVCIISSVHAQATTEENILYASSKSALSGLVKGLTATFKNNFSAFEIILGAMDSPMLFNSIDKNELAKLENKLPSGKVLSTSDVANLLIDLINNYSKMLHGSSIRLDNGILSILASE